jgi:hypothetical protein
VQLTVSGHLHQDPSLLSLLENMEQGSPQIEKLQQSKVGTVALEPKSDKYAVFVLTSIIL